MQTKKTIENLRKLDTVLPRITLVTIYKAFFRPHLDYEDSYTTMFLTILSMIDQNLFNITPVFQYEKWGYLQRETISRIRFRFTQTPMVVWKTSSFYKDFEKQASHYLFYLILVRCSCHTSRNVHSIPIFNIKAKILYRVPWISLGIIGF